MSVQLDGRSGNESKTEPIEKLRETPKTVGDLRKLLGFLGYYRQSIENFSQKAKPIYDILSLPSENLSKSNHKLKKTKGQKSSSEPILWSKDHANIISEFIEELKSPKTWEISCLILILGNHLLFIAMRVKRVWEQCYIKKYTVR